MRKAMAAVLVLLVSVLLAVPAAWARDLAGWPFFVFQNFVGNSNGNIYIYDAAGVYCGSASIANLDTSPANRLAFETARNSSFLNGVGANGLPHQGVWYVAGLPGVVCGMAPGPGSPLNSYYTGIF